MGNICSPGNKSSKPEAKPSEDAFSINVKLADGKSIPVYVRPAETFGDIKAKVEKKIEQQPDVVGNKEGAGGASVEKVTRLARKIEAGIFINVDDQLTIADAGIKENDVLLYKVDIPGDIPSVDNVSKHDETSIKALGEGNAVKEYF
eukprot:CAMPEP_0184699686 /NCGR_PEP_ID=MMETSP0313-20130426/5867_1 /TAXON_ID=2792 /ORGANISM="Porphyridium aerugineum, Strain SAG 1380-2" /LENGTH=146 /DNA_ID=CAMNT_0027158809 /DNA_START=214 /DNA_END=654 /DNA_ORIENTATION=-